jgi:16S rRNA (uracil1498-N3)-methyltransferase
MVYRLVVDPAQIQGAHLTLEPQQSHYLWRVLRLTDGDRLLVLDGRGQSWWGQIEGKTVVLGAEQEENNELAIPVNLIMALPKGNGLEEILRPITELGVQQIFPLLSERTLLRPSAPKLSRWRRILQEATEQCERQQVPQLHHPQGWADCLPQLPPPPHRRYLCVTRYTCGSLWQILSLQLEQELVTGITLAIGPEGGWTAGEIQQALAAGFEPVSLGPRILRTLTAPIVALAQVSALLEA